MLATALVLKRALPQARHLPIGVKVLIDAAVIDDFQDLEVLHHEAVLLILKAHLLET